MFDFAAWNQAMLFAFLVIVIVVGFIYLMSIAIENIIIKECKNKGYYTSAGGNKIKCEIVEKEK